MRIAEISPNDLRRDRPPSPPATLHHQQEQLLSQIESLIMQIEAKASNPNDAASLSFSTLSSDLRQTLARLSQLFPLTNILKLQLWKLSYRLWNSCVDIANAASLLSASSSGAASLHVSLRHSSADILALVLDVSGVPSPLIKAASFYLKTGLIYHDDLKEFDLASSCFEKATDIVAKIDNVAKISDPGETKLLLELNLARSRTAWELADRNLAVTLLNRSKGNLLFGSPDHYKLIASQYLEFGKTLLSLKKEDSVCNLHNEALKLINETLDLCEKGLGFSRTKEQTMELKGLRSKALRFISAVHLQKGEYESVIKCVRVLREDGSLGEGGDQHASLPVLAMKAWLGLGRYVEAEKELRGMVVNKGVPEGVWVGAVEEYFESAGTTGAETAKGLFLGLYGRCHVSAGAAVRVARRVIAGRGSGRGDGGDGSRVRAKVVAELVSDERVLGLFKQANVGKERNAMHAVLWDCASDHFMLKDYSTSAEMFEKSLLYVPHNIENRNLRAKGFRVLCLCHLAMSQLDRALEYISEAEKLEPNICCAFLKYKIFLQNKEHDDAVNQIQAMRDCLDFSPDFLLLSAHEAVACQAFTVAVVALSSLLSFYTPGKPMPITEVVVLRTLITMLSKDPGNEMGVLKFMKLVHSRALELGTENFYGKGEEGRREQNWFAVTSWNFGTRCGKEKKYEICADFFRLASDLFSGLADGDQHQNVLMVCKSLILAACSMMALENQKKELLSETKMKHTVELLDKADKILTSFSVGTQIWDDRLTTLEPQLFVMYTFVAYDIHGRIDNFGSRQQLLLVKNFASSKACNSKYLLQLGLTACQGPRSNLEVATFALNESLSALLSSPSPDYQDVALILRRLIAVASNHKGDSDDEAVHDMYKQAYRIMVGLQEGEYPAEEGKWLAMTAWNRAALPVRTGQIELAMKWMNIGLEIATKVIGMETYRACMEDSITALGKTVAQKNCSSIAATST